MVTESKYSSRMGTPELTERERSMIPVGQSSNNRYEGVSPCPIVGLEVIQYKRGKRGYILKHIDWELNEALNSEKIYGKSVLTRCKFTDKETGREVFYSIVYKGIAWARLQYMCEKWNVKLEEIQ